MASVDENIVDWRRAYQALDPLTPVSPGSAAYCAPPEHPLGRLAATLRLNDRPGLYLVSGHIGTGKSTELLRLVQELEGTHRCFLEQTDADLWHGTTGDEAFLNILTLALKFLGTRKEWRAIQRGQELGTQLRELAAVSLIGTSVGLPDIGPSQSTSRRLEQAASMAEKVRNGSVEPLIVLDGFDKVALADLERLFIAVARWGYMPVSVVLTVPLSFLFTPMFASYSHLFAGTAVVPAIRIVDKSGAQDPGGVEWMGSVLARRVSAELIDHDATELLIRQTGGILRDFLRVARESTLMAHMKKASRVTFEYAEDAVHDFSLSMSRAVSPDNIRLLYAVHQAGRVIGDASFLQLIDSGHIIEYRNGSNWYAVHPLLKEAVESLGAVYEARAS